LLPIICVFNHFFQHLILDIWQSYEAFFKWDEALIDIKAARSLVPEDKLMAQHEERIRKMLKLEKDKEKKTWGKAFGM
jgi:hypothetical protein